jgi:hypothetical protein
MAARNARGPARANAARYTVKAWLTRATPHPVTTVKCNQYRRHPALPLERGDSTEITSRRGGPSHNQSSAGSGIGYGSVSWNNAPAPKQALQ